MDKALVSILINAHNSERYIGEAIDSALAQTWPNFEIVIVEDASTDRTAEIIKSYNDPRIRYFHNDHNQGIVGSRNQLLKEAKGEFFTWLDADDIYLPDRVQAEVEFLEAHPEFAGVYSNILYFFDGPLDSARGRAPVKFYRHIYEHWSGDIFGELLKKMFITNSAFMMRRSAYEKLGGFNPATGMVEDWEYFLRMAHNGMQIGFLDKDLIKYRLRFDSHTNFARQVDVKKSQVKIFENLKQQMTPDEREKWHIDYWIDQRKSNLIFTLLAAGKSTEAKEIFAEIKRNMSFKRHLAFSVLQYCPAAILRTGIEYAWNRRKKHLFVPA
ncbi:MAG: glycosyltransferase family 2 protein [Patescibacteria group bacterium]|nr:glycosyltransferase family 2 protein [Patescibacteria group bacterium]